ncbi:MAG: hypothetical protein RQ801_07395 [Spirochaetaceae bacterium]|nr:hypothetical protein [Spirochaetaceae bacterium]MDT8298106.1 hypothetical protein [Spirochaetaceae bacterium]
MNTDRAGKLPPRNQPEMPSYFRKDRTGRDEFLSQLGHFGEEHRALFSRLCDMWEPDLPYSKFFSKAGHEYLNAEATLHTLMIHLEKGNCGLIANTVRDGKLEKDRIILTDRDSPRFWYWLVENSWHECRVADRKPFPTLGSFAGRGGFPQDVLQPLSLAEISSSFIDKHADDVILYALPDIDGMTLIVTPAAISFMVDVARIKIRAHLADSPVQPILSRLLGTVVSSLRASLGKNDNLFWNKLADAIIVHREDLLTKKANLAAEIFIAAKILKIYTRNELDAAEQRREEDAEKRETIQGILAQLAGKESFLMPPEEFDAQFEPYKENWPDLRELFVTHYMKSSGRTGLPPVVNVGEDYIHRDHLYPLFKTLHKTACLELREFYLEMIERILKTNNKDRIVAFTGIDAFREDIRTRLAAEFKILSDLLAKPRMVSEGVIHYVTKVLKISDMERVKGILERYFESGSIKFKHPDRLFDLPPKPMFEEAFHRLSWFRRAMLRLFGRYDSYLRTLKAVSGSAERKTINGTAASSAPSSEREVRPYSRPTTSPEGVTEAAVRRRKQAGSLKSYSAKQQEQAWDDFRSAYEKKKK